MKKILALILVIITLLSLCACGAAKSESYDTVASAPAETWDMVETEEVAVEGSGLRMESSAEITGAVNDNAAAVINADKIIYSANASVETTKFDETLSSLDEMVASYGAFIESSSISGTNYYNRSRGYNSGRHAKYRIRVPSDKFNDVMSGLSILGNITRTNTYTDNITAEYYDTDARLKAYRTQEESLLSMLEKAETIEDIIAIEDKLSEVRYRIESLQSTLRNWDRQVSYSTIELDINEVDEYTPEVKESYGQRLSRAFKNALEGLGNFFEGLLVVLVAAAPTLVILAVIAWLVIFIIRKRRARRRAKKQSTAEQANKTE